MIPVPAPSILLVDDEVDICENMADILADLGYDVAMAHDGPAALEILRGRPYDVALLDLRMPGMDGLALYREIKKLRPGTAAIIVTGFAEGGAKEEALGLGALHVLKKPVDLPHLMGHVEQALGRPLVLVVDDDRDLCGALWDLLHERGYRVCLAHSEAEAAGRLGERPYRAVLIDMRLPDGDGGEVYHRVREANPETRTVVITGQRPGADPQVERLIAEGADAVHYKPFDVPELLSTLGRLAQEA